MEVRTTSGGCVGWQALPSTAWPAAFLCGVFFLKLFREVGRQQKKPLPNQWRGLCAFPVNRQTNAERMANKYLMYFLNLPLLLPQKCKNPHWSIPRGFGAERAGFEPAIRFPAYTLSRRAPSTTRTSLCVWKRKIRHYLPFKKALPRKSGFRTFKRYYFPTAAFKRSFRHGWATQVAAGILRAASPWPAGTSVWLWPPQW